MPKRTVFHVTHDDGQWKVKKENAQRATSVHDTKKDAVDNARVQAKKEDLSQVVIHKKDNTLQEERTYGNDPHPPDG